MVKQIGPQMAETNQPTNSHKEAPAEKGDTLESQSFEHHKLFDLQLQHFNKCMSSAEESETPLIRNRNTENLSSSLQKCLNSTGEKYE